MGGGEALERMALVCTCLSKYGLSWHFDFHIMINFLAVLGFCPVELMYE